ncbi:thiol-disulfide oxidoreductase DCC family protein [Geminocystis herdmanii]|uniref:thiol-disulfide oxidoreductase DCC family protein n=1 Tax=Geminocystis herdmanii TaxID=669359 RepID=UPI00034C1105|nr:DCC1-like thiol-disulfide oxidoreductase family protein [Geminocystis herdmanii]
MTKKYHVIYDGNCNLCVTFTQLLENFDKGNLFNYIPMQNIEILQQLNVTSLDCELGMILIDSENLNQRWQGSFAAEKIIELLPNGQFFINAYRAIPSLKWLGDKSYLQIRDNRYQWFGSRENTYYSTYDFSCKNNHH